MSVHLQMAAVNTPVWIPSSRFTVSAGKDTLLGQIKQLVKVKLLCICQFLMQCLHNFAVSKLLGPIHVNFVLIGSLSNSDCYGYENVTWKWIRFTSNFIALIPTRPIRQMLANFSGVEF